MNNFETSFNDWEAEISKYETEQGQTISDDIKIGILFAHTKGHGGQEIHRHLILNTDVQMSYTKVRQIVNNYFTSGRVVRDTQVYSKTNTDGPVPMEIDAIWRAIQSGKQGKNKGGRYAKYGKGKDNDHYNKGGKCNYNYYPSKDKDNGKGK